MSAPTAEQLARAAHEAERQAGYRITTWDSRPSALTQADVRVAAKIRGDLAEALREAGFVTAAEWLE